MGKKLSKSTRKKQRKKLRVLSTIENKLVSLYKSLINLKVDDKTTVADIQNQLAAINIKKLTKAINKAGLDILKNNRNGFDLMLKNMVDTKTYKFLLNKSFRSLMQEQQIMQPLLKKFEDNVVLIKNLPNSVYRKLQEGYLQGVSFRGTEIERYITERMGNRAKLIIRTESAKLNAALTQVRAQELSLNAYIWSTSEDIRVRPTHKMMDGVLVFWNDPPTLDGFTAHCGEYINDRCVQLPVFSISDIQFPIKVAEKLNASVKKKKLIINSGKITTYNKIQFIHKYGGLFAENPY
jgi:SPP1 gp7 family putative phage head morphogenesis protein